MRKFIHIIFTPIHCLYCTLCFISRWYLVYLPPYAFFIYYAYLQYEMYKGQTLFLSIMIFLGFCLCSFVASATQYVINFAAKILYHIDCIWEDTKEVLDEKPEEEY